MTTLASKIKRSKQNESNSNNFDIEKIRLQLKRWQEKLLDTSRANPLLGLNRARAARLKIKDPTLFEIFQKLVTDEAELRLPHVKKVSKRKSEPNLFSEETLEEKETYKVEEGDLGLEFDTPSNLRRKMRRIYDNSRTTVEERGVVTLYATFGAINWQDDVLGESVSPIILVPCELISKGPNAALRLRKVDEEIQINPAVVYYFREKHKIDLPDLNQDLEEGSLKEIFKKIGKSIKEQDWKITEEAWLGTFTFESLVLYQDLKLLADLACSNSIVAAFSHASANKDSSETLGDDLDSLETPGTVPVPVLPTDSSQLKALTHVSSNKHVVIHGPPGTGKSQTISNIIAEALGQNKKVLFVSAKMAALNVVFDRLKKEGLGQFCLEAHGTKAGKLKIIEELKRTLELEDLNTVGSLEQELEMLKRTRKKLNEYVIALHSTIQPLMLSVFQAIGRFAKLQKIQDVKSPVPWPNILKVSDKELENALDALSGIAQMSELFNKRHEHPWRGFQNLEASLQIQEQIEADIRFVLKSFTDINDQFAFLKKLLPKQDFTFDSLSSLIPMLDSVSKVKKLPEQWWDLEISKIKNKDKIFSEASLLAKEFKGKITLLNEVCELQPKEVVKLLQEVNNSFKSWHSRISFSYLKWRQQIKKKFKSNTKLGYQEFRNYYDLSEKLVEIEDWFSTKTPILSEEVPPHEMSDWQIFEEVANQCRAAITIRNSLPDYDWKQSKITVLSPEMTNAAAGLVSTINDISQSVKEAIERINKSWPDGFVNEYKPSQVKLMQFGPRANEVLENLDKSREWILLQRSINHAGNLDLKPFIDSLDKIDSSVLPLVFAKRFWMLWIDAAINQNQTLADFSSSKHRELIDKLKVLDERIRRLTNSHIRTNAALNAKKVKSANSGLGNGSEIGILRNQMQRRRGIMPLRKLFSEIPTVLQALKPCMLMSPISVSTFLKPESFHFDLVIFDEASQLPTPEAIPSILRADQVVVAGDPNQLPPTSFFNATIMEDDSGDFDDEPFAVSLESLLDDCVASVPTFQETYLKWHYRSRDERLVNFSNHYFYDNKLITFPSACTDNKDRGVKLEYVEHGVWDRGKSRTNRIEARRAAQLAIEHFTKFPERSLGIVALNVSQKEAIEDALDEELIRKPELLPFFDSSREEAFFVKSLESVQGDERDVILISIGYGKNADGALTMNFGPLNIDGGWRRLNVLVTRAKWQTILLTSLRSAELSRINSQNRGALSLKNFIEYAERGGSLPPDPTRIVDAETNDFEDAIRAVLVDRGYSVDAQVGAGNFRIDLAVRDPKDSSKYLIGIECDGATYHSSRVARDRDLLREDILRNMGWILHRIWSTEWFHNRNVSIKLMLNSIERAMSRDPAKYISAPIKNAEEYTFKPILIPTIKNKFRAGTSYIRYKERFRRDKLINKKNNHKLAEIIVKIVEVEGPIHLDVLSNRLKEVFKVQKIGANIEANIEKAISLAVYNKILERKKSFIWKRDDVLRTFRTPGDEVRRPLQHISPREISLAILYLVEDQFGVMRDQIPQAIARVFEISRISPEEVDRVREIVDELIEKEFLAANGTRVSLM